MPNRLVIFPASKLTEAQAYKSACDTHYASTFEAGGQFGYVRPDAFGQWVTPLYGPPWTFDGTPFTEPAECAALRIDGVEHDTAVWPEEE